MRKPNRGRTRERQLDDLYAQLPSIACRGLCQEACGPIEMSILEAERIEIRYGKTIEAPCLTCSALGPMGTCTVYDARPLICRLWGLTESMACPHGCKPEGGYLSDDEARRLINRSVQIGGEPASWRQKVQAVAAAQHQAP
jgi:Fe-S-cluster containining protein